MRPSKKKIVRIIENIASKYLSDGLYTAILFSRYVHQRSAGWIAPKPDRRVGSFEKFLFAHVPGCRLLLRANW